MRSAHHAPETSTRYIGWCPICERDIKVRAGTLVHHGYERPGVGYIIGDCPGVGHKPYETGTDACDFYLRVYVVPKIREAEETLAILNRPEGPPYLTFEHYDIATGRVLSDPRSRRPLTIDLTREKADALESQIPGYAFGSGHYSWERRLQIAIASTESKLRHWDRERGRMDRLIAEWAPEPLRTVEQEIQRQEQTRAERELKKTVERNQKLAAEVAKLQKRIDSAVKNKNSSVLADIYVSHKLREISKYSITQEQAIQMLDRDAVWMAFELMDQDGYSSEESASKILNAMRWGRQVARPDRGYDTFPLPWPDALGGGIAKTRGY